jgi:hypothetical protein
MLCEFHLPNRHFLVLRSQEAIIKQRRERQKIASPTFADPHTIRRAISEAYTAGRASGHPYDSFGSQMPSFNPMPAFNQMQIPSFSSMPSFNPAEMELQNSLRAQQAELQQIQLKHREEAMRKQQEIMKQQHEVQIQEQKMKFEALQLQQKTANEAKAQELEHLRQKAANEALELDNLKKKAELEQKALELQSMEAKLIVESAVSKNAQPVAITEQSSTPKSSLLQLPRPTSAMESSCFAFSPVSDTANAVANSNQSVDQISTLDYALSNREAPDARLERLRKNLELRHKAKTPLSRNESGSTTPVLQAVKGGADTAGGSTNSQGDSNFSPESESRKHQEECLERERRARELAERETFEQQQEAKNSGRKIDFFDAEKVRLEREHVEREKFELQLKQLAASQLPSPRRPPQIDPFSVSHVAQDVTTYQSLGSESSQNAAVEDARELKRHLEAEREEWERQVSWLTGLCVLIKLCPSMMYVYVILDV